MIAALLVLAAVPLQVGDFWTLERVCVWRNAVEDLDYRRKDTFDVVVNQVGTASAKVKVTRVLLETMVDGEVTPMLKSDKPDTWEQEIKFSEPTGVVAPNRSDPGDSRLSHIMLLWLPGVGKSEVTDTSRFKLPPVKVEVGKQSVSFIADNFSANGAWRYGPVPELSLQIAKFPLPGSPLTGELRIRTTLIKGKVLGKDLVRT